MKTTIVPIAIVLAGLFTIGVAEAKKLTVCEDWQFFGPIKDPKAHQIVICFDNEEKPFIMHDVTWVERKDKDGNSQKLAVGSR